MNALRRTIEIDFDVHQAIEAERRGFDDPPNSALRRLLKLGSPTGSSPPIRPALANEDSWTKKGVTLPEGTELHVKYAEVEAHGRIIEGKLNFDGKGFSRPSPAVMTVIEHVRGDRVHVNGWMYVYAKRPGEESWTSLAQLRDRAASRESRARVMTLADY